MPEEKVKRKKYKDLIIEDIQASIKNKFIEPGKVYITLSELCNDLSIKKYNGAEQKAILEETLSQYFELDHPIVRDNKNREHKNTICILSVYPEPLAEDYDNKDKIVRYCQFLLAHYIKYRVHNKYCFYSKSTLLRYLGFPIQRFYEYNDIEYGVSQEEIEEISNDLIGEDEQTILEAIEFKKALNRRDNQINQYGFSLNTSEYFTLKACIQYVTKLRVEDNLVRFEKRDLIRRINALVLKDTPSPDDEAAPITSPDIIYQLFFEDHNTSSDKDKYPYKDYIYDYTEYDKVPDPEYVYSRYRNFLSKFMQEKNIDIGQHKVTKNNILYFGGVDVYKYLDKHPKLKKKVIINNGTYKFFKKLRETNVLCDLTNEVKTKLYDLYKLPEPERTNVRLVRDTIRKQIIEDIKARVPKEFNRRDHSGSIENIYVAIDGLFAETEDIE